MKKAGVVVGLIVAIGLIGGVAYRQDRYEHRFGKGGFIQSAEGKKYWYSQTYREADPHFMPENMHDSTHQDVRTISFKEKGCMVGDKSGLFTLINKKQIMRNVSRWFAGTYVRGGARDTTLTGFIDRSWRRGASASERKSYRRGASFLITSFKTGALPR